MAAYNNLGVALNKLGQLKEAIRAYSRAIEIQPENAAVYNNLGNTAQKLGRLREAITCFEKALSIQPNYSDALCNLGNVLQDLNEFEKAATSYKRALEIDHDKSDALSQFLKLSQLMCNWRMVSEIKDKLIGENKNQLSNLSPFVLLGFADNPEAQRAAAENYLRSLTLTKSPNPNKDLPYYNNQKIHIGYVSSDFRNHAMSHLTQKLFQLHDRSSFKVSGFSIGPSLKDEMTSKIKISFDEFINISDENEEKAARTIQSQRIDILVDLNGYTRHSRPEIFFRRPAPIQVSYLGFPATMGTDFIDYILVDSFLVPDEFRKYYAENLVYLPDTYWVTNSDQKISSRTPTRRECGLPEEGFVFCSFNSPYKITSEIFDIWMKLLDKIPSSVLWLIHDNECAASNLRDEARRRGIRPERLVFAPRVELESHLARHRLADLFLDTLPCNAHTTASDALYVGLPVLTCSGRGFASRVAGSLLTSVGMSELITHTLTEYETKALSFASNKQKLLELKAKLANNLKTAPLFNTDRFRLNLERAYKTMHMRSKRGQAPASFHVPH